MEGIVEDHCLEAGDFGGCGRIAGRGVEQSTFQVDAQARVLLLVPLKKTPLKRKQRKNVPMKTDQNGGRFQSHVYCSPKLGKR